MPTLVLATRNAGKVRELAEMLAGSGIDVRSLAEWPDLADVVEDADTFAGNATKKAVATATALGLPALADDSGLVVDALDGRPGVYSARYGGPGLTDPERCERLLAELADHGQTSSAARFRCAMALARPDGAVVLREAAWEGTVRGPRRGENGFGYDPVFEPADADGTAAQLDSPTKNRLSHRGQALALMVALLRDQPELLAD
ncbi:MAG: RdgB/HAM1 family non-canonical purine NTP pyrophosphatase [Armatimonadetes bacterium]|nr:RdgB/HAM1 family non-canonical purine NTP pyrophosphatase [Armatimonadota bacterium]